MGVYMASAEVVSASNGDANDKRRQAGERDGRDVYPPKTTRKDNGRMQERPPPWDP